MSASSSELASNDKRRVWNFSYSVSANRPTSKLNSSLRSHSIPNRQDCFQPVMIYQPRDLPISFGLNYSEFPNSCLWRQFPLVVNRCQMLVYSRKRDLIQVRKLPLGQPYIAIVKPKLNTTLGIVGLIKQELARIVRLIIRRDHFTHWSSSIPSSMGC